MLAGGPRKISPFFIPGTIINMISGNLSIMYGLKGPNLAMVTACTTATHCIGESGRLIEYGDCDVMIAGGAESVVTELAMGGFAQARALSTRNDDPAGASRPWDRDRDGFVLGEGAGVLVLEEYEHAKARGAKIYAELAGYGMSGDAYHMTAPREDGEGAARCMDSALRNARAESRPGRLHQCPWHVDAAGRSRRDHRREAQPGGARQESRRQFDQVDDRAFARRRGRRGGRVLGVGGVPSGGAADDQYVQPGSAMRPGLCAEYGAPDENRRGAVEFVRFRRHQRHPGVRPDLSQSLTVSLRPSRVLALALTVMAAAAFACAWVSLPRLALAPVAAGIALGWIWHVAQAMQRSRSALRTLELNAKGGARCEDARGEWREAEILPGSYVSSWLVVVALGAGGRRWRSLVLLPDAATAEDLRRLRVWLRWRLARP